MATATQNNKAQLSFLPQSFDRNITLSEFLTSQTSIVAPAGAELIKRHREEDNLPYFVTQFDHIIRDKKGNLRSVQMEIETHGRYRSTNDFDDAVFLAIQNICWEKKQRVIKTTNHEIILKMNLAPNGKVYDKLEESLDKLNTSTISSDYWIDHETGEPIKEKIPFLAIYKREVDESRTQEVLKDGILFREKTAYKPVFTVGLHEDYWRSLKEGGVPIDLDVLALFKSKTKKNIFRFLNTVFSVDRSLDLPIRELALVAGINPDTFAYESRLKQRLHTYLRDFEKEEIIKPLGKQSFGKRQNENRDISYVIHLEAGPLYDDLSTRFEVHPAHYDVFMKLREFSMPVRECLAVIDQHVPTTDVFVDGRSMDDLESDLNALMTMMQVVPDEVDRPLAWLRNCIKQVPPWDHQAKLEMLNVLRAQDEALTAYQRSGKLHHMNSEEQAHYTFLMEEATLQAPLAQKLVRERTCVDKIDRLIKIFPTLSAQEQTPNFVMHLLKEDDSRLWREAIPGSEQDRIGRMEREARQHGSSYDAQKNKSSRENYESLFEREIVVEAIASEEGVSPTWQNGQNSQSAQGELHGLTDQVDAGVYAAEDDNQNWELFRNELIGWFLIEQVQRLETAFTQADYTAEEALATMKTKQVKRLPSPKAFEKVMGMLQDEIKQLEAGS